MALTPEQVRAIARAVYARPKPGTPPTPDAAERAPAAPAPHGSPEPRDSAIGGTPDAPTLP